MSLREGSYSQGRTRGAGVVRLRGKTRADLRRMGFSLWTDKGPLAGLMLIPGRLLLRLPRGLRVTSIDGEELVVGRDRIDDDTRGGSLAFGVFPAKAVRS